MNRKPIKCKRCDFEFGANVPSWCPRCFTIIYHADESVLSYANT